MGDLMKKILLLIVLFSSLFASIEDDKILYGKLDNEMSYLIRKNSFPKDLAYIYLFVDSGSINEDENELGLAHLVEHLAFSGSEDYKDDDIIKALEKLGVSFGAHLNASTSFNSTIYKLQIKTKEENIAEALNVLENIAHKVSFENKAIEREKKVVAEEERISNSSSTRILKQELPYIFPQSIYEKRLPIGNMQIIKKLPKEKILSFYENNYYPKNMTLLAVGDFDENKLLALVKEKFSSWENKGSKKEVDKKIAFFDKTIYFNAYDSEVSNDEVRVYFEAPAYKINSVENLSKDIINNFIIKAFSLFSDSLISNKIILKNIYLNTINLYNQKMLYVFSESALKNNYKASLNNIFSAINYIKQNGFSEDEFEAVKKEMISQNENFLATIPTRKSDYFLSYYLDHLENDSFILSEEQIYNYSREILKNITLDDINQAFKDLSSSQGIIFEVLSQKAYNLSPKELEKIKNSKAFKIIKKSETKDEISSLNLKPVAFLSSSYDPEDGIYKYEFKNGAEVFFKALDNDKDNISFRFMALGGSTNINNLKAAQIAIKAANQSGVGTLNEYEYQKFKKGKLFYFLKYINELSRGYEGQSQLSYFEDMLKAFYIDFTNPKIDAATLERHANISIDILEKNEKNPEYKFAKEENKFYYDNNPKLAFFEKEDFYNLHGRQLFDFIKTKFSNAGEFYLLVSGDIKKEEFEALIKKYIGNLPGNKTGEIIKDDKIRPLSGNQLFERYYAKENIAKVKFIINNENMKYSEENKEILQAALSILSNVLREKIRAEQGKIYGISVYGALSKLPYPKAQLFINFSSNPENRYEIIETIKEELNNFQNIDESYLDNYKKMAKIELEKLYKENSFWKRKMENLIISGEDIPTLEESQARIDKITLEEVKNILKECFLSQDASTFISIFSPQALEELKAD